MNEFPCQGCGSKKRFHKKGCSTKTDQPLPVPVREPNICCAQPMTRTDGSSYDVMCRHYRLLTQECKECRHERHGILIYQCFVCGRQVQDSPGLAQGPEALKVSSMAR